MLKSPIQYGFSKQNERCKEGEALKKFKASFCKSSVMRQDESSVLLSE